MEELISSIYHLVVDIFMERQNGQQFYECITDLFNIDEICEIKQLTEFTTKDSFLFDIVSFLEQGLYSTFDYFSNTNVFLLYRDRNLIIIKGTNKKDAQKVMSNWIREYKPIERIFGVIKDSILQKHKERICSLLTDANYSKIVRIERAEVLESTLIPKEWIIFDSVRNSPIDISSIWINKDLTSIVGEISEIGLNELTYNNDNGENIGLVIGDYILPLNNIDDYIVKKNAVDYFWSMLKKVYAPAERVAPVVRKKQYEPFIEKCKESDFCKLLSFLHHNLYIKGTEKNIPSQFIHLFEEVYSISGLEHLSNFCFYTGIPSTTSSQTLLGVYEYKKSSSEYNLLNWVNHGENDKHKITRCDNCFDKESQKVYALLPQYSYYFMSRYFEDVFTEILKELKCDYVTNVHLSKTSDPQNDFIEIDALVKSDNRIVYFENKTTLSKFNIDDTICKIEKFHSFILEAYPDLSFEYIIISPYCDETIKESYWYFAKEGHEVREDIKHYTYDFEIPLAKFDNISLRCIVEPEYDRMRELIKSIIR